MEEEHLDELIRRTLAESRRSPEPPLDEMWAHIERKAFDESRRRTTIVAMPTRWSRWLTPVIAAAAALVIGVGLGWSVAPRGSVVTRIVTVPAQSVATAQPSEAANTETPATVGTRSRHSHESGNPFPAELPRSGTQRSTLAVAATPSGAADRVAQQQTVGLLATRFDDTEGNDVSRYLVRTAALLRALPADKTTARSDTAIAGRAAELLTQTHLLLDSRAGSDPTLHKLLEDLELVLAQVARLRVKQSGTDLQLIHQALTVRDVLPRVHDATVEASITD